MSQVIRMWERFDEIIAVGNKTTEAAVDRFGLRIENGAKERSRVDTGKMRNDWQSRTIVKSGLYGYYAVEVFNPTFYTIFNEFGTVNMDAQPMLRPSIEEHIDTFITEVAAGWA